MYWCAVLTNCDWLDLYALLNVRVCCVVIVLAWENLLAAKGVDESGTAWYCRQRLL